MNRKRLITILLLISFSMSAFACTSGGMDETVYVTKSLPTDYSSSAESEAPENSETESSENDADVKEESATIDDTPISYSVKLGEYTGLSLEVDELTVTYGEVQDRLHQLLGDDSSYTEVEGKAALGDIVNINMTGVIDNDVVYDYSQNSYDLYIGNSDFGSEFDDKLVGLESGDKLEFSITYTKDDTKAEFPGKTIKYNLVVNSVESLSLPELTEDYLEEKFGVSSESELMNKIQADLLEEKTETAKKYNSEVLLQQVIDNSTVLSYSDSLYKKCKEEFDESYKAYWEIYDVSSNLELYSLLGLENDDIESEILDRVYRKAVIYSIADAEGFDLNDENLETEVLDFIHDNAYIYTSEENSEDSASDTTDNEDTDQ